MSDSCQIKEPLTATESLQKAEKAKPAWVVVTGATGFVGKRLCQTLTDRGYKVRVLVRSDREDPFFRSINAQIYTGDICDPEVADWVLDGAVGLFNLAAVVSKKGVDVSEFRRVHVEAVENLLDAALRRGVRRFVQCSTIGVLGDIGNRPADEETPLNAKDEYQLSKAEGEKLALSYNGKEKLEVTVVRPAMVYGPGDTRLAKLFRHIATGRFRMIGTGATLAHPVYIDDLVEGMILALNSKKAAGRIYILGGDRCVTLNEWAAIIAKAAGVKLSRFHIPYPLVMSVALVCEVICAPFGIEPPLYRRRVDFFIKNRAFAIDRAKEELGYNPMVNLEEGAKRTLAALFPPEKK